MKRRVGWEFWTEAVVAGACGGLALVTLVWREWIEAIFGVDPDHGNGSVEWLVVGVLAVLAIVLGARARALWQRAALVS